MIADAKAEAERLVAEANAKVERSLGEQTARNITEQAEDMERRERERILQRQEELARQQLESEFQADLPEIRVFAEAVPRRRLHATGKTRHIRHTTEKGPVSFCRLKGSGLLDKDVEAITRLHLRATANRMNDRPYGSFPPQRPWQCASGLQSLTATSPATQELLNKYGELMVEKEMLAP